MQTSKTPAYNWHLNLDRSLQQPTIIIAAKKGVELRKFVSDTLREKLIEEGGE